MNHAEELRLCLRAQGVARSNYEATTDYRRYSIDMMDWEQYQKECAEARIEYQAKMRFLRAEEESIREKMKNE